MLEETVERWSALAELLESVVASQCLGSDELPQPEAWERAASRVKRAAGQDEEYAPANL